MVECADLTLLAADAFAYERPRCDPPSSIRRPGSAIFVQYGRAPDLAPLRAAALASGARLDTPMFVMYGGRDEIVPRAPIRRFVDGLPAEPMRRRKLAWYENDYHMLLRDLQAPVVIADVASWVLTPAAPLPSGADRTAAEAFLAADGRLSLAGR